MGERYREGGTLARLLWEHPWDAKFPRYLHRLTMPTLLVWGEEDRLIPANWRMFGAASYPRRTSRYSKAPVTWCSTRSGKRSTQCSGSCL